MKTNQTFHLAVGASLLLASLSAFAADMKLPALSPLPPVPIPKDNPMTPEKVALGQQLFWDGRVSGDGAVPCVICHLPGLGWGDGQAVGRGGTGTHHWRNSQTIINSAYYNKLFWDGSSTSLESQAKGAAGGAVAGNGDDSLMEIQLRFVPEYVAAFKQVFGTEQPRMTHAWMAIAAYQRTLVSDATKVPFDRFAKGDKKALSAEQQRGLGLFNGKAGCLQCHNGGLASDQRFYATGVPDSPEFATDPARQITHRWQWYQKGVSEEAYRNAKDDAGLYYVTKNAKDIGKFRTPSLRELKYTAPYMHNGVFATLDQVVDFYDAGGGQAANKSALLKPLKLSEQEKKDLTAFLEALSMDQPLMDAGPKLPAAYQSLK